MAAIGMPLLVHGEVPDPEVDIFDREAVFVERSLAPLVRDLPELKVVLEHVTTAEGVDFVAAAGPRVAATITPQHLLINPQCALRGRAEAPRLLPTGRQARAPPDRRPPRRHFRLSKFFLGTDSAPHAIEKKEAACGCAGIFNAPFALETYLAC
jgi:dihydroorotase